MTRNGASGTSRTHLTIAQYVRRDPGGVDDRARRGFGVENGLHGLADQQDRTCELTVDTESVVSSSAQVCEADEVTGEEEVDPCDGDGETVEASPNEEAFCFCPGGVCC